MWHACFHLRHLIIILISQSRQKKLECPNITQGENCEVLVNILKHPQTLYQRSYYIEEIYICTRSDIKSCLWFYKPHQRKLVLKRGAVLLCCSCLCTGLVVKCGYRGCYLRTKLLWVEVT